MIIERTKNEIIFRLPANLDVDDLQDITDLFEYQELAGESNAAQKDVDLLVKSIKKERWERTKKKLNQ